jgi:hypothetical protein
VLILLFSGWVTCFPPHWCNCSYFGGESSVFPHTGVNTLNRLIKGWFICSFSHLV